MSGLTFLIAQAASVVSPPLVATGPWTVLSEPTMCTLSRDYGTVGFGISSMPASDEVEVAFVGDGVVRGASGTTALFVLPARIRVAATYQGGTVKDGQRPVVAIRLSRAAIEASGDAETLWLEGGGAATRKVRTGGLRKALAALRSCEDQIAPGLGIDVAAMGKVKSPAAEIKPMTWIPSRDYPRDALEAGVSGESRTIFIVETDGRATDCRIVRSAGFPALDRSACSAIQQHARYRPALDDGARPVRSWRTMRVRWRVR